MDTLLKFYRLLSWLSIDVAIGTVCSSIWFAVLFEVQPGGFAFTVLGLTVWIIYTFDHLVDAKAIKNVAKAARYRFHQKHFSIIVVAWVIAMVCNAVLIFFIREEIFINGLWLSSLVTIYFLFHRYIGLLREFFIAIVYSVGVLLPVLSLSSVQVITSEWVVISSFSLTALINILLFSWFDYDADVYDGQQSFTIVFGQRYTLQFIKMLFIVQVILQPVIIYWAETPPAILLLSMNGALLFILCNASRLKKNDTFRLAGDAVFFFPAVALFLRWIF